MRKISREAGFTLIEVVLAALFTGIVLLPVMGMFLQGHIAYHKSWQDTVAINLAQDKLEELRGDIKKGSRGNGKLTGNFAGEFSAYSYEADISDYNGDQFLKNVALRVRFMDHDKEQEVLVQTLVAVR